MRFYPLGFVPPGVIGEKMPQVSFSCHYQSFSKIPVSWMYDRHQTIGNRAAAPPGPPPISFPDQSSDASGSPPEPWYSLSLI
jgi:hypothetical protein